ncbi:hypothetical protein C2E20_1124 [Micractinium conductrix]|uniref:Uncharacterized protein n=1 Tax=Micractinium conductrix TaxID=554055 RepID=A0A2P6VMU1_9CHLO|nr:hypothetical protein C2E20_1124 [Micractinium conductrix]|eukprot:PSC75404.1 hypothetical protein C2E20_1124 [Micractinium conductrix]
MSATEARAVLRALLRAVDRNVTSASGNRQWREFVLAQWRANAASSNEAERSAALQEAKDYALLIDSIREHKELLLSYNIGIPIDDRERDMNARAATLVGLAMPPKAEPQ